MKIDKRIILYLDNQLNSDEMKLFEAELSKSAELSNQFAYYKNALQILKVDEQKFVSEDYFVNLVPKFKAKLVNDKKSFKIRRAYAIASLAAVVIAFFVIFKPFDTADNDSVAGIISSISENEAVQIYNYYSDNSSSLDFEQMNGSSDSLFTELLVSEIDLKDTDVNQLFLIDGIKIENVYSELQTDEVELIYNEILKTKYF